MRGIYAREHAAKVQTPVSRRAKLVHLVFPLCNDSLKREHWICFRSSWKKRICPPATAWYPSLLAHRINYKLTISKSHGQTRVKQTQHGDKVFFFFSQERQTNLGFTLTICTAVSAAQAIVKITNFISLYSSSTFLFNLLLERHPISGRTVRTSCFSKGSTGLWLTGSDQA